MSSVQELKESLLEADENYQRVMELNTHLKKDKSVLMYQLDTLREELGELEEELWETKRSSGEQNKFQLEEIQRLSDELKERQDPCNNEDLTLDKGTDHVLVDSYTEPAETPELKEGRKRSASNPGVRTKRTGRNRCRTFRRSQSMRLVVGSSRHQHVVVPVRKKSPQSSISEVHLQSPITGHSVATTLDQVITQEHVAASSARRSRLRPPRPACDIILDAAGKLLMTPLNERANTSCFLLSHLTQNAEHADAGSFPGLINGPEPQVGSGSSQEPEADLELQPKSEPDKSKATRPKERKGPQEGAQPEPVLGLVQKDYIRATWDFGDSWRSRLIFHEFHFAEPTKSRNQGTRYREAQLKQTKRRRNKTSSLMVKNMFEKTAEEILAMTISDIEEGKVPTSPRLLKQQRRSSSKHKSKRLDSQFPEISGRVIQEVGQEAQEAEGQAAEMTVLPMVQEEEPKRGLKDKKRQKKHPNCKVS